MIIVPPESAVVGSSIDNGVGLSSSGHKALSKNGKRRIAKLSSKKTVSFDEFYEVQEYDEHDFDPREVYSQADELQDTRQDCLDTVRANHQSNPAYRTRVIKAFRTRNFRHTDDDLEMLSASPCRGLERKLSKVFNTHRRWAVEGVLKMQETRNDRECLRYFSKRASQPCVAFARLLAKADRKAANAIYEEDSDDFTSRSSEFSETSELSEYSTHSSNYWSDSSRSLWSTDTMDTIDSMGL